MLYMVAICHVQSVVTSWTSCLVPLLLVVLFLVADFYVEAICSNHLDGVAVHRLGSMAVFVSGLLLSMSWSHPFIASMTSSAITEDHMLSGGVIFSFVLFMFGQFPSPHPLPSPHPHRFVLFQPPKS